MNEPGYKHAEIPFVNQEETQKLLEMVPAENIIVSPDKVSIDISNLKEKVTDLYDFFLNLDFNVRVADGFMIITKKREF